MTKIIQRHDTSTNWTSVNPVLALGEMGIETDTNKFKFGDGVTNWTSLSYASAEGGGGGGADLSNYYTKDETYNQEEVDTLLDEKQDVLTPSDPIKIGTTTIGEPNKISIVGGGIISSPPMNVAIRGIELSGSTITLNFYKPNGITVTTLDEAFKNTSYIDIPVNLGNIFTNDYSDTESIAIKLSGMTNIQNSAGFTLYLGSLNNGGFTPYITSYISTSQNNTSYYSPINAILAGSPTLSRTNSKFTQWTSTATVYNTTTTYLASASDIYAYFTYSKSTNGTLNMRMDWSNGAYRHISQTVANVGQWDLNTLQKCNVARIVFFINEASPEYYPTVADTTLSYNSVDTGWRVTDGIVTTYGISLKYDNQTIQVNSEGELVANLDELGNEVNTLAGSLNGKADTDGSNMVASVKNFDGQPVVVNNSIYSSASGGTLDLSTIIPQDGYVYECNFFAFVQVSSSYRLVVYSMDGQHSQAICNNNAPGTYSFKLYTSATDRILGISVSGDGTWTRHDLQLQSYRRVGTNE